MQALSHTLFGFLTRNRSKRNRAKLGHHSQLIPVVPGLQHFSVYKTLNAHASGGDSFSRGLDAEEGTGVLHRKGPLGQHHLALFDSALDFDMNCSESGAKRLPEVLECFRPDNI